ncbi:MAG TPA: redoxin domain-containing protein [Lentimicrobium sp.]|jgi:thiol-disulfide isomerase/thioredoxin|nr:redoxin domain-containing protein [Lentimicrobium sp.]
MRSTAIALLITFLSQGASAQVPLPVAPDFLVKDVNSNQHNLYDYLDAGNLVVIDFFTTNCGPCQTYASHVSASYEYFGCNYGNVIVLGINWGSNNDEVRLFDSLWGANYPAVSGQQGGGNAVVDMYQVQSYPTVILIAPDRTILNNHIWPPSNDILNAEILAAGGVPLQCTVNTTSLNHRETSELTVMTGPGGQVILTVPEFFNKPVPMRIYSVGGSLTFRGTLIDNKLYLNLKPGIYVAVPGLADHELKPVRFVAQ